MLSTTKDQILDGSITILQPEKGYRVAIDPILLSAAINIKKDARILDMGCGVGTISLILANRDSSLDITGIDIQSSLIDLAKQNIKLNNLDNVRFTNLDIQNAEENNYDIIISNPPYVDKSSYSASDIQSKNIANSEDITDLNTWIKSAYKSLKNAGEFYMIHRADRLDDIIKAMHNKFGNIIICPLFPKPNKSANRIIIYARKNKKDPLKILKGIILHEDNGNYTNQVKDILYNKQLIDLSGEL